MEGAIVGALIGALVCPTILVYELAERYHSLEYPLSVKGEGTVEKIKYNFENIDVARTIGMTVTATTLMTILGYIFGAGVVAILA